MLHFFYFVLVMLETKTYGSEHFRQVLSVTSSGIFFNCQNVSEIIDIPETLIYHKDVLVLFNG